MVRVSVILTDNQDRPIPGVGGPLQGVTGLSYTPEGCVLDGIGSVRFKIPLTVRRNTVIAPGMRVQVLEDTTRAAWAVVTAKSETISADGIYAQFDCPDILFLLQKITPTSGYATAPNETAATTLARLVQQDRQHTWSVFSDLYDPTTGATAYDGIPFSVQGTSVIGAILKYAGERFSHAKRGIGLSIEFGTLAGKATFAYPQVDPTTLLAAVVPTADWGTITVTSAAGFPVSGNYDIKVGAEPMTVWAGQGTTTWAVIRGPAPVPHAVGAPVTAPGINTTMARLQGVAGERRRENDATRLIALDTFKHEKNGEVVNDLVPVNGDSGIAQLTLRTLYNATGEALQSDGSYLSGPLNFAGYNPVYPIRKRVSLSAATFDGFDYFLRDDASIAANDLYMENMPPANISPVKNAAGGVSPPDLQLAAIALYQFAVSRLQWAAKPQETISCSTSGYADVRNFAGKQVHVYVKRAMPDGTPILSVDLTPTVLKVTVSWDDATGDPTYAWELSTNAKQAASFANLVLGRLDQLSQQAYRVDTLPVPIYMPKSQNIGPGADLVLNFPARNNVTSVQSMLCFLTLEGMVHTRDDQGHTQDVVTASMPHDVNALPHDVAANPHDVNALPLQFAVGGALQPAGTLNYDPSAFINLQRGTPPGTAFPVYFRPGVGWYLNDVSGSGLTSAPVSTTTLGVAQAATTATANGTGGTVKATTGGKGGKVQATTGAATGTGQAGGTVPTATHKTTAGFGATKATATIESVYRGPLPTGVKVLIDGVVRFGPFNASPPPLDFGLWITNGSAHEVRFTALTNGAADVLIQGVEHWTTLGVSAQAAASLPDGT